MEQIWYQELSSSKINSQFITMINRNKNLALNVWKKKKKKKPFQEHENFNNKEMKNSNCLW